MERILIYTRENHRLLILFLTRTDYLALDLGLDLLEEGLVGDDIQSHDDGARGRVDVHDECAESKDLRE